jgi:carbonic anhydrase
MLEDLLKANKEFLESTFAHEEKEVFVAGEPRRHWAIVTCMSCRLTDFIDKALGFKRGDAIFIQNAGNTITPYDNSIIRSLAVGIYALGVKEVAVIGHTDCGMKMDVAPLTDAFTKYNKSREMLKDVDLREWFGLIPNEEINVRHVVDTIKSSTVIPKEIPVYGLMINTKTGELKEVYRIQETMKSSGFPMQEIKPVEKAEEVKNNKQITKEPALEGNKKTKTIADAFSRVEELNRKFGDVKRDGFLQKDKDRDTWKYTKFKK